VVNALAVQGDGKILVGGDFFLLGGAARNGMGRLNPNGTLDTSFNTAADGGYGVSTIAVQPDGKVLAAGGLGLRFGGVTRGVLRLSANGTLESSFNTSGLTGRSLIVQPDGKILVGGRRLNADGTVDASFNPNVNGTVLWTLMRCGVPEPVRTAGKVRMTSVVPVYRIAPFTTVASCAASVPSASHLFHSPPEPVLGGFPEAPWSALPRHPRPQRPNRAREGAWEDDGLRREECRVGRTGFC
jgi:uncharacterized delta-60 repeat protein